MDFVVLFIIEALSGMLTVISAFIEKGEYMAEDMEGKG